MKILLFGGSGQVGWELQRSLAPLGELVSLGRNSIELCGDLADLKGIAQTVDVVKPDIIVNAAAYTAVDNAESESDLARTVNTLAPGALAIAAKCNNALLVHYSTDYVFDGSGDHPRTEDEPTAPINVYGETKLGGEQQIVTSGCQHLIFRTSWVYATYGDNFIKTMLRLAQERDSLKVINDQIGAPTGADLLADISAHCIRTTQQQAITSGCYNLVAKGYTSWYDYADFIFNFARQVNIPLKIKPEDVLSVPSHEFSTVAKRPFNSRLDTSKLQNTFGLNLPPWQMGVARVLIEILKK